MTGVVTSVAERAESPDLHTLMQNLGRSAVAAAERLALADTSVVGYAVPGKNGKANIFLKTGR